MKKLLKFYLSIKIFLLYLFNKRVDINTKPIGDKEIKICDWFDLGPNKEIRIMLIENNLHILTFFPTNGILTGKEIVIAGIVYNVIQIIPDIRLIAPAPTYNCLKDGTVEAFIAVDNISGVTLFTIDDKLDIKVMENEFYKDINFILPISPLETNRDTPLFMSSKYIFRRPIVMVEPSKVIIFVYYNNGKKTSICVS